MGLILAPLAGAHAAFLADQGQSSADSCHQDHKAPVDSKAECAKACALAPVSAVLADFIASDPIMNGENHLIANARDFYSFTPAPPTRPPRV